MSKQTMAEKIFSSHSGETARAGDVVMAAVDTAMVTDGSGPLTLEYFKKMGGVRAADPSRVLFVLDHYVPCPNDKVSRLHDSMRRFAGEGNGLVFDLGEGVCHQLLPEKGYALPGRLVIGGDSHSTTYGAFNCMGMGLGSSDIAAAMLSGKCWFRVPESYRIELRGKLRPPASPKDAALRLVGEIGAAGAVYKAIEFCGPGLAGISVSGRMTLCNMMTETGAKCVLMPCDDVLGAWLSANGLPDAGATAADPDAVYEREIVLDLDTVEPMIAKDHRVDSVVPLAEMAGIPVHMGVLGTCTNGRIDDFESALEAMGELPVAAGFELLVAPASRDVYLEAMRLGLLRRFVEKGAYILPPGCGPCCGSSPGIPSDGENVVSTANRNFIGRMGNVRANIFLASPASVAAAAAHGRIVPPKGDGRA